MTDLPVALELVSAAELPDPDHPSWRAWLTELELAYCLGLQGASEHLAARLVTKRAVARVLGWDRETPWLEIETRRVPPHGPTVRLSGAVERWRRDWGHPVPGASLTHAAGHAAALAWLPEP